MNINLLRFTFKINVIILYNSTKTRKTFLDALSKNREKEKT